MLPEKRKASAKPWFQFANGDLRAALVLSSMPNGVYPQIAYHCQQAAEKSMKGFLIYHGVRFQKTHNLVELLGLIVSVDSVMAKKIRRACAVSKPVRRFVSVP